MTVQEAIDKLNEIQIPEDENAPLEEVYSQMEDIIEECAQDMDDDAYYNSELSETPGGKFWFDEEANIYLFDQIDKCSLKDNPNALFELILDKMGELEDTSSLYFQDWDETDSFRVATPRDLTNLKNKYLQILEEIKCTVS